MTPSDVLQRLLDINKPAARLIIAGLGLLAAAAIAVTWIGSNPAAILLAVYVLGFGILVSVTAWLVTNPRMRAVLGWLLTGTFALFLIGLVDSATGFSGRMAAPACYVRMFLEPREACEARLSRKTPVAPETVPDLPAPAPSADTPAPAAAAEEVPAAEAAAPAPATIALSPAPAPASIAEAPAPAAASHPGDVYLQSRPEVDRNRMLALARTLAALGWSVPNGESGGEAWDHAPIENEVRYFDAASHDAALRLARDLAGPGGIADVILADQTGTGLIAAPGQLEIWIGH
jgi:hypothetical protein